MLPTEFHINSSAPTARNLQAESIHIHIKDHAKPQILAYVLAVHVHTSDRNIFRSRNLEAYKPRW